MGFFDSIKNALGGDKSKTEAVKGPSLVLKEAELRKKYRESFAAYPNAQYDYMKP